MLTIGCLVAIGNLYKLNLKILLNINTESSITHYLVDKSLFNGNGKTNLNRSATFIAKIRIFNYFYMYVIKSAIL